ncbi:MAG: RES domain-containing protein [Terracidiphilus sp.]
MTPEDQSLNPDLFLAHQPLTLYRLARAKYANLSGVGAALDPGRWNRLGEEAIYTSTEVGVPVLEMLAHTSKNRIPSNLALMRIRISGQWEAQKNALIDPKTSACLWFYRSLAEAREAFDSPRIFAVGINPFAVAVPSVIVPVWNIVLYPKGFGFWDHVSLESLEGFQFDPRLFPEDTPEDEIPK